MTLRCLATAAALALMTALPLHAAEKKIGRVGDFDIIVITEKGKFDRCTAQSTNGSGALRLAYNTRGEYALSIPGIKGKRKGPMSVTFDGGTTYDLNGAGATTERAWVMLGAGPVDSFLNATDSVDVTFAGRRFTWVLYNQTMEDMFIAIENCTIERSR